MEDSHISFGKWIYAIEQKCVSKRKITSKQLQRELAIGYRSAWFMRKRLEYVRATGSFVTRGESLFPVAAPV
jgi:hypothetical protein